MQYEYVDCVCTMRGNLLGGCSAWRRVLCVSSERARCRCVQSYSPIAIIRVCRDERDAPLSRNAHMCECERVSYVRISSVHSQYKPICSHHNAGCTVLHAASAIVLLPVLQRHGDVGLVENRDRGAYISMRFEARAQTAILLFIVVSKLCVDTGCWRKGCTYATGMRRRAGYHHGHATRWN